jgi:hypothetical protein
LVQCTIIDIGEKSCVQNFLPSKNQGKWLADTNNFLAKLNFLVYKNSSKDWHGERYNAGNHVSAVSRVSILATEAVSLQILNTFSNSSFILHEACSLGQKITTFFTGPVTRGEDGSLLADSKQGADITVNNEVVVDAGGYVLEPHIDGGHASICILKLGTDNGFQDFSLFSKTGVTQEMVNKGN